VNVLVVSPHPDDDAIAMGGTIAKHVVEGDQVSILYVTSGEKGGDPSEREFEAGVCSQVLGTHRLGFYRLPDGESPDWDLLALGRRIRDYVVNNLISLVYSPGEQDEHIDHRQTVYAVTTGLSTIACKVLAYEVTTPVERHTDVVDITSYATIKRAAIRAHKSQLANSYDEAILALNHYRGLLHAGGSGVMYAEAFQRVS
jgi:N-acetylglucosamine malate deacetylase 1